MEKIVCHITSVHHRYDNRIFRKECTSLALANYKVYLIVNDDLNDEVKNNVSILNINKKKQSKINRIFGAKKNFINKAVQINADLYHIHDPELLPLGDALIKRNKKVIFDSHEDVPNDLLDKNWIPKVFRRSVSILYEKYEKKVVKDFSAVVCVTPNVVKRFRKTAKRVEMITNYPIVKNRKLEKIDLKSPIKYFRYAGVIEKSWNHHLIIKAISEFEDVKYLLAGRANEEYLSELKNMAEWKNVEYKGFVSHDEVEKIYQQSIAGFALNQCNQLSESGGTLGNNKLFEYMYAGIPVVCTNYKLWEDLIEEYNCGIAINPDNYSEIVSSVEKIITTPSLAKEMGNNGKIIVEKKYNWQTQEEVLINLYKEVLGEL